MNVLLNNKFFVIYLVPFLLGAITILSFSPYNLTFVNFFSFSILLFLISLIKKRTQYKYRKKNKSTDVLSFPSFSPNNLKLIKKKNLYVGDIATCYEIIDTRSDENNFFLEFDKAWVHGLLHLVGYDHRKNKDYFEMNRIEKRILNSIT